MGRGNPPRGPSRPGSTPRPAGRARRGQPRAGHPSRCRRHDPRWSRGECHLGRAFRPKCTTRSSQTHDPALVFGAMVVGMAMKAIQLFSIPVSDPERAKAFYVDTLGWELVRDDAMGPDQRWVQVRPRGGETSVTLVSWFESMPAGSMRGVVIETDDLEADQATLLASG